MRMQKGSAGERNYAVETKHVERVVRTKWNLDAGDGPLELHAGRTVQNAVSGAEKCGLGWAEPVGKKPAGAKIKKTGGLHAVARRNAIRRMSGGYENRGTVGG